MDRSADDKDERFGADALACLPAVTRYALSLTRDEADADDLVQDTFLKAYRGWDSYTPGTDCRSWLFTICRNSYYRTREREARFDTASDAELEALAAIAVHQAACESGYEDLFTRFDLSDAIWDAIWTLSEPFREALVLVDVNDTAYAEAAAILDVPIGTVRSRLFRARRLLQESLIAFAQDVGLARNTPKRPPSHDSSPGREGGS